ncbi:hypothetical protein HK096_003267, partial [Nowakowskiella sp. JEL0078]
KDFDIISKYGVNVVTLCWLECCIEEKKFFDFIDKIIFKPLKIECPISGFQNYSISISGFEGVERSHVGKLAKVLGANCNEKFSLKNTHLICGNSTYFSTKPQRAREWKIPLVTKEWLIDCAKTGMVSDVLNFEFKELSQFTTPVMNKSKSRFEIDAATALIESPSESNLVEVSKDTPLHMKFAKNLKETVDKMNAKALNEQNEVSSQCITGNFEKIIQPSSRVSEQFNDDDSLIKPLAEGDSQAEMNKYLMETANQRLPRLLHHESVPLQHLFDHLQPGPSIIEENEPSRLIRHESISNGSYDTSDIEINYDEPLSKEKRLMLLRSHISSNSVSSSHSETGMDSILPTFQNKTVEDVVTTSTLRKRSTNDLEIVPQKELHPNKRVALESFDIALDMPPKVNERALESAKKTPCNSAVIGEVKLEKRAECANEEELGTRKRKIVDKTLVFLCTGISIDEKNILEKNAYQHALLGHEKAGKFLDETQFEWRPCIFDNWNVLLYIVSNIDGIRRVLEAGGALVTLWNKKTFILPKKHAFTHIVVDKTTSEEVKMQTDVVVWEVSKLATKIMNGPVPNAFQ